MEIIQLINIANEELNNIEKLIKWALKELGILDADVIIYITDNHNRVREALGIEKTTHEEWPIKYMNVEDMNIISIVPDRLLQLSDETRNIMILREVALMRVMSDPTLISIWNAPPNVNDPIIHRVSLALLRRVVDLIIAQSSSLIQHLIAAFNKDELRNILLTCQSTIDCAITALALDVPLSIELSGNMGLGRALWSEVTKNVNNDFLRKYDDFRDFVRNNFNAENMYNYLLMLFRKTPS
ncbi:MAG: hypothetical protein ACP5NQ_02585 [Vulcanisaeta sp.]